MGGSCPGQDLVSLPKDFAGALDPWCLEFTETVIDVTGSDGWAPHH